jgi:signal transduction histidine kinase
VEWENLPVVDADEGQIRQLMLNLIGNALKFHHPERPARVRVGLDKLSAFHASIYVEDNGIGFDPENGKQIFLPFRRLHGRSAAYEGTGMGLAICQKIVEQHGGSIKAYSQLGEGSRFVVILPASQDAG